MVVMGDRPSLQAGDGRQEHDRDLAMPLAESFNQKDGSDTSTNLRGSEDGRVVSQGAQQRISLSEPGVHRLSCRVRVERSPDDVDSVERLDPGPGPTREIKPPVSNCDGRFRDPANRLSLSNSLTDRAEQDQEGDGSATRRFLGHCSTTKSVSSSDTGVPWLRTHSTPESRVANDRRPDRPASAG